jgi:hypothetical protein
LTQAAGVAFLLTLGLGLFLPDFSLFCLVLSFVFITVSRYRRRVMRWLVGGAGALVLALYAFGQLTGFDLTWTLAGQMGCLVAGVGGILIQYFALRAGDRPERTS